MASFWFVSIGKNPAKSDKLALVEGMLMNLMFLVIYIPVVPFENWLRVTQSKTRMLKTTWWVECGSSLLKLPEVTRDSAASKEEIKIGRLSFKVDEGNKWIFVFFFFYIYTIAVQKKNYTGSEFISEALQHQLML